MLLDWALFFGLNFLKKTESKYVVEKVFTQIIQNPLHEISRFFQKFIIKNH